MLSAVCRISMCQICRLQNEPKNSPGRKPNPNPKPIHMPNPFPIPNPMPLISGFCVFLYDNQSAPGKNFAVTSALMVSLGPTKHRLLIKHFKLQTSLLSDNFLME